jgi:hypothetical protein
MKIAETFDVKEEISKDPISIASVSSGMQCIAIIIPCMDVYNCHYGNIKD